MGSYRNVVMTILGGVSALLIFTALITGMNASMRYSSDPSRQEQLEQRRELEGQDAWFEFWSGGALLVALGVIAAWPTKGHRP